MTFLCRRVQYASSLVRVYLGRPHSEHHRVRWTYGPSWMPSNSQMVITLPETNIAMENPPFWWYFSGKMGIFMGYVSFREGKNGDDSHGIRNKIINKANPNKQTGSSSGIKSHPINKHRVYPGKHTLGKKKHQHKKAHGISWAFQKPVVYLNIYIYIQLYIYIYYIYPAKEKNWYTASPYPCHFSFKTPKKTGWASRLDDKE